MYEDVPFIYIRDIFQRPRLFLIKKYNLTSSEGDVALLLAFTPLTNGEIGDLVGMREKSVKYHITSIYKKSGCKNRAEFILDNIPYMWENAINEARYGLFGRKEKNRVAERPREDGSSFGA